MPPPAASSPASPSSAARALARPPPVTLADVETRLAQQLGAALTPAAARRLAQAELKRLRHCETVRQSRARKKQQRSGLRTVHDELETQLRAQLAAFARAHDLTRFDESRPRDVLLKRFALSIAEVRALRREQAALRAQALNFDALGAQLQRLQQDFAIPRQLGARTSIGTVHFAPLSAAQARAVMLDAHRQATSFFDAMRREEPREELKTMGWTQHQRITPDGRVQFNFTKRLRGVAAEPLVHKSWQMYCDFGLYHGIYSSVQKLEILQRINDNTLLIRRDLQEASSAPIFRTIFLLFRIRLPDGYLICFRSHNPPVCVEDDDDPNVQWMDMFYWLMITDPPAEEHAQPAIGPPRPPEQSCDVTFGGNLLNSRSAKHATIWKYQIAMALLRWESNAAAPLFALYG